MTTLADADDQTTGKCWRAMVEGEERGGRKRNSELVVCAKEVLGIAGGVIGASARGNDDKAGRSGANPDSRLLDKRTPGREET